MLKKQKKTWCTNIIWPNMYYDCESNKFQRHLLSTRCFPFIEMEDWHEIERVFP